MQKQYKIKSDDTQYTLKENIQKLEKECIIEYIDNYIYNSQNKIGYSVDVKEGNNFVEDLKKILPKVGIGGVDRLKRITIRIVENSFIICIDNYVGIRLWLI